MAQGSWYAEYFSNPDLAGGPVLTRYDNSIHFEWGAGSPGSGVPADNFSARWTHEEWFEGGTYRFSYRSDDGIRIWVGGALVVDDWRDRQAVWSFVDRYIPRGTHTVRVEYYEHGGGAAIQAAWERVSGGEGWRGEYFDNRKLSGSSKLVRYDPAVDFDWEYDSPHEDIPADNFSVRWTRTLGFTAGTYRFSASCDDGVRVYVDGNRIVDAWQDQKLPNTHSGDIYLNEGQHTVMVEYYDHGGEASAHVWWKLLGSFSGWEGRYYDNRDLRGGPALVRDDAAINFDWGEGAPADWMPSDNFSAVWTRNVAFSPGYYRFNVRSDDGVRVWLDDRLLMDYWKPMDYEYHYVDGTYLEGTHTLKVEYFERAGGARIHFWWDSPASAPAPSPSSTPSAPTASGPWRGEYFNALTPAGSPALVRNDAAIDFNWGWDAPAAGLNRDNFSVRWSGTFSFEAGRYRFSTTSDDGVRVYVDGQAVIDAWTPMRGTRTGYATLSAGDHNVRVEYFERTQAATVRMNWERVGAAPAPAATSVPALPGDQEAGGPWQASYYANLNLSGDPTITRQDGALDFDWGWNSPDPALPADNFSVVWTRQVDLSGGRYIFTTTTDDGVRLYVDGQLVINAWTPMRGTLSATLDLSPGTHTIRMEYFERVQAARARLTWQRTGGAFPFPTPQYQYRACDGGPLTFDLWTVDRTCGGDEWTASIYFAGRGGDCMYTYMWERQVVGGPTPNSMTFQISSKNFGNAIVGTGSVSSAGQTVKKGLFIRPPDCD